VRPFVSRVVAASVVAAGSAAVSLAAAVPVVVAAPPDSTEPQPGDSDAEAEPDSNSALPGAPPLSPGIAVGTTEFERQLAEISFATFITIELGLDAGDYACTEPRSVEPPTPIQCFTIIDDDRVIVAQTEASNGTGRHQFQVVSDQQVADLSAADQAVLDHGEEINEAAEQFVDQYLAADPRITDIGTFRFDPDTVVLTLDMTLAPDVGFTPDVVAWVNTREFAKVHWSPDSPFRNEDAALRPGFTIVVNGSEFVSDYSLMTDVADEDISQEGWLEVAER
jgi:hypothetical protein